MNINDIGIMESAIKHNLSFKNFDKNLNDLCIELNKNGYIIIKSFIDNINDISILEQICDNKAVIHNVAEKEKIFKINSFISNKYNTKNINDKNVKNVIEKILLFNTKLSLQPQSSSFLKAKIFIEKKAEEPLNILKKYSWFRFMKYEDGGCLYKHLDPIGEELVCILYLTDYNKDYTNSLKCFWFWDYNNTLEPEINIKKGDLLIFNGHNLVHSIGPIKAINKKGRKTIMFSPCLHLNNDYEHENFK